MAELQIKDKTYYPVRLKLRKWLEFEKSQEAISKAVENKNIEEYAKQLYVLISTALNVLIEDIADAPWFEIANAFAVITNVNRVKEIPLLKSDQSKSKEIPWEYEGRSWFWWVHIFGKNYHWTQNEVEALDIDDAISLLQEILVDDQLTKEWQWDLSEIAYPYNANTKKSEHKPLPRPNWMQGRTRVFLPALKLKFKKSMLPIGSVIGEDGNERLIH